VKIGIIGCGINGAYLAWRLSEEHDVTVFEKRREIGKEVCSGLVSERLWDFIPKNNKIIQNIIKEIIVHFPKKNIVLKLYPEMMVLNRILLDKYVAELARKNGAKILLSSEVEKVFYVKNVKPQISVSREIFEFDYLIGCDGYSSLTRKVIGINEPDYRLGIFTYVSKKNKSNKINVYALRNGFSWIIPRGSKTEYGVLEKVNIAKNEFQKFCKTKRIKPRKIYSHIIPEGLVQASKRRVVLCGDAIGLTKPWSAGGIIWGLMADEILVNNFPNFKKYNTKLRKFFEPKIFFFKITEKIGRYLGKNLPYLLQKEVLFDSDWIF